MPSRRISAPDILAPYQEIAVNPYASYNSDNVNMLTRIVTGRKDKDFVINGLDVTGLNRVSSEVAGSVIIDDLFVYSDLSELNVNWLTEYMDMADGGENKAVTNLPSGIKFARCKLKSKTAIDIAYLGDTFKIEFSLTNTPKELHVVLGSETFTYRYPDGAIGGTDYTLYMDLVSENGVYDNLTFFIDIDTLDQYYNGEEVCIDNVKLTRIINKGQPITPIVDPTVDPLNIPERLLHPHETAYVSPGVCVKDETMINMAGTKGSDPTIPVSSLPYGLDSSWINGHAFTASDFIQDSNFWDPSGTLIPVTFTDGELTDDSLDDGEAASPKKISGDIGNATIKWAYICIYYSYFKHIIPNKAYIGLATEEEISNSRYGEDYLILAKLRFIDKSTVDAIFYYPQRQDWGFIDASKVTYLHLSTLKHWLNRPINVSLALDELAYSDYHMKGCLFFQTQNQFNKWKNRTLPTGVGHGPYDYMQKRSGSDPDNSNDLLAYVVETNSFWKSRLSVTNQIDSVIITNGGSGYVTATIDFVGGVGSGAQLKPIVSSTGTISEIRVVNGGSNYFVAPTLTISGGSNATATAYVVNGKINNVVVNTSGSGYDQDTVSISITTPNQHATANATISDGVITQINITHNGYYASDVEPSITITGNVGSSEATAVPQMGRIMDPSDIYSPVIIWEEVAPKQFELNWSQINNGSWPTALPLNWTWWTGSEEASTWYSDIDDVKSMWPSAFYKVAPSSGVLAGGNQTIVNPFNMLGRGLVPGPVTDEVVQEKFLRSDGTWQWADNNKVLMFDNYIEFKTWYNASNSTYEWTTSNRLIKLGRRTTFDYDVLIFVIEDNTYWRTPTNPTETGNNLGSGWTDAGWAGDAIFNNVPSDIKRITNEFETRWGSSENEWAISSDWEWSGVRLNTSTGSLVTYATGTSPAATLDEAKAFYPNTTYIIRDPNLDGSFRVINPYNPTGNGLVPGPTTDEVIDRNYLRSDGKWSPISNSLRFYLSGWPQDDMWVGKIIVDRLMIIKTGYYRVQHAPQGITLRFTIYHNNTLKQEIIILTSVTVNSNVSFNLTTPITVNAGENISVKITQVGNAPNEGGNDLAIVLF